MAKGNRQAAEAFLFNFLKEMHASPCNEEIYRTRFKEMSDAEFDDYMGRLARGEAFLTLTEPNLTGSRISTENNVRVAKKLFNHEFFQHLNVKEDDGFEYQTPIKFMVIPLPWRRAAQTRVKKNSVPPHSRTIDAMTGQVTGESKGAAVSYPELQLGLAMGAENTMQEFMRIRGGDVKANQAMKASLAKYGRVSLETLSMYGQGATVARVAKAYLIAMHLKNNLV